VRGKIIRPDMLVSPDLCSLGLRSVANLTSQRTVSGWARRRGFLGRGQTKLAEIRAVGLGDVGSGSFSEIKIASTRSPAETAGIIGELGDLYE
jgi:hypothetical protein